MAHGLPKPRYRGGCAWRALGSSELDVILGNTVIRPAENPSDFSFMQGAPAFTRPFIGRGCRDLRSWVFVVDLGMSCSTIHLVESSSSHSLLN